MRIERINEIKDYMALKKSASLQDLCKVFDVSLNTIRRDINQLENEKYISKVYGGIILNDDAEVVPLSTRRSAHKDAKEMICRLAADYLSPGSTIYIDSGTTTPSLLNYISPEMNITVISNSLNIYNEAIKRQQLNIISPGGLISYSTNSFIGISTIENLKSYNIHTAFMGCTAVDIHNGATNNSYHESEIKKNVVKISSQVILLADSSKINTNASLSFASLSDIDVFITEKKPDADFLSASQNNNLKIVYPVENI